ncbi:hypothetical protein ECH_0580 [Ehrlichia chaffeensis str. Arkansas]|uniref:Uncharacterized protein n=1 Tax=Ehrlichia chaffeensis (strain ATCC CRL-10679 / Arkansas) TaxID=205920 RepID=Q2GGP2_EHRCR|nr:hypothetical protein ECH_0580 [Ehrlichia chaffeensis str. Arkansas]
MIDLYNMKLLQELWEQRFLKQIYTSQNNTKIHI